MLATAQGLIEEGSIGCYLIGTCLSLNWSVVLPELFDAPDFFACILMPWSRYLVFGSCPAELHDSKTTGIRCLAFGHSELKIWRNPGHELITGRGAPVADCVSRATRDPIAQRAAAADCR
jgi:hypothetical protein